VRVTLVEGDRHDWPLLDAGANHIVLLPCFESLQEMKEREAEFEHRFHKLKNHWFQTPQ
jgi:hypothetical protein